MNKQRLKSGFGRFLALLLCLSLSLPNPVFDRGSQELAAGNGAASSKFSSGNVPPESGASPSRSHALRTEANAESGLEEKLRLALLDPTDPGKAVVAAVARQISNTLGTPTPSVVPSTTGLEEWNQRVAAYYQDATVAVLGGRGFVGGRYLEQLLNQWSSTVGRVSALTTQEPQEFRDQVVNSPGLKKLTIVRGDHLHLADVRELIRGAKVVIDTAGLAWQHLPGGKPAGLNDELLQNSLSAALIGLVLHKGQRLVWTSSNASDYMFARMTDEDRQTLQMEIDQRARRYVTWAHSLGDGIPMRDQLNAFIEDELRDHPADLFSKGPNDPQKVIYAEAFSYPYSKLLGQRILEIIGQEDDKDIRVLKISDVYGPGQRLGPEYWDPTHPNRQAARRPQWFMAVDEAIATGQYQPWALAQPPAGFSKGPPLQQTVNSDYVAPTYIDDVVRMMHRAAVADLPGGKVVLSVSAPWIPNAEMIEAIASVVGVENKLRRKIEIVTGPPILARPPEPASGDLELLGMRDGLTPLKSGLAQHLSWWRQQPRTGLEESVDGQIAQARVELGAAQTALDNARKAGASVEVLSPLEIQRISAQGRLEELLRRRETQERRAAPAAGLEEPTIQQPFLDRIQNIGREAQRGLQENQSAWASHLITNRWKIKQVAKISIPEVPTYLVAHEREALSRTVSFSTSTQQRRQLRDLALQEPLGSVLILGLGHGYDIPLLEILLTRAEVVVMDLDEPSVSWAVDGLRGRLDKLGLSRERTQQILNRLKVRIEDISGIASEFSTAVEAIVAESHSKEEAIAELGAHYAALSKKAPWPAHLSEESYGLVISSSVTSAMLSGLMSYAKERIAARFGDLTPAELQALIDADQGLARAAMVTHGHLLKQKVKPGGDVYWADTVVMVPIYPGPMTGDEKWVHFSQGKQLVPVADFTHVAKQQLGMGVSELGMWGWSATPPKRDFSGIGYYVLALRLTPPAIQVPAAGLEEVRFYDGFTVRGTGEIAGGLEELVAEGLLREGQRRAVARLPSAENPGIGRVFIHADLPMRDFTGLEEIRLPADPRMAIALLQEMGVTGADAIILPISVAAGMEQAYRPAGNAAPIIVMPAAGLEEATLQELGLLARIARNLGGVYRVGLGEWADRMVSPKDLMSISY